jgi:hypothetical protein
MVRVTQIVQLCCALAAFGSVTAWASDDPTVHASGWVIGGPEARAYSYPVDGGGYKILYFRVGTGDLDAANYANVTVPPGWQFAVTEVGMQFGCGTYTTTGLIAPTPCASATAGSVVWWTEDPQFALDAYTFGFDHHGAPQDVAFALDALVPGHMPLIHLFGSIWQLPVGAGMGPVYGPSVPVSCFDDGDCDGVSYCWRSDCNDESGWCLPQAQLCAISGGDHRVCGCDGITYGNACLASQAGMNVAHVGPCRCFADFDNNGVVDAADFFDLLQHWGGCEQPPTPCPWDFTGREPMPDGRVDTWDFFAMLQNWGPCM